VLSPERIVGLESQVAELKAQVDALTKMLFGKKSEKSKKSKEQSPEPPESGLYLFRQQDHHCRTADSDYRQTILT